MMKPLGKRLLLVSFIAAFGLLASPASAAGQHTVIYSDNDIHHPVYAPKGMVATQEALASKAGLAILKKGGNAVDAAVAVGFALAVTVPRAGNIGGGGFMMIYNAKTGKTVALDYREKAPGKAFRDMYLDDEGEVVKVRSRFHGLAVGVPGTVAGLTKALKAYGTMSLPEVMAPAIKMAEEGILVTPDLYNSLIALEKRLKKWPSSAKVFYKGDAYYQIGDMIKRPGLANTLKAIAEQGRDAFYQGPIAEKIAATVTAAGGLITVQDLADYQAVVREPVTGTYRGYQVVSMPPPSSGGTHIVQILNILEGYPIKAWQHNSATTIHYMAEAMKLAYADRSKFLGDSDFAKIPVKGLTSKKYATSLREQITALARPASDIAPGKPLPYESNETTHFSIVDKYGNAVANTYTLNFSYGTGMIAGDTGILLNNEMDDFSAKPGVPNAYGLIGGAANAVEPNKRPLSSMSPTIVLKNGKPFLVTGSPGGSRIITTTLQIIMNVIDHDMNIAAASNAVRIHDQWLPDEIRIEKGLNIDTIRALEKMGHKVVVKPVMGSTQSIMKTDEGWFGASDPRRTGALTIGY